jgi:hypothetical protein
MASATRSSSAMRRSRSTIMRAHSGSACEKFSRATSIPARTSARRVSVCSLAGPIVATILVRFIEAPLVGNQKAGPQTGPNKHGAPTRLERHAE